MAKGDRYVKVVEWSDADNCFIGSCPGLFYGGCHGDYATQVFIELCEIIDEAIDILEQAGKPLPPPRSVHELGVVFPRSA